MIAEPALKLTHQAVFVMLSAACARAEATGQPPCIGLVDASGETFGQISMSGAKYLSLKSARTKARSAARIGAPRTRSLKRLVS